LAQAISMAVKFLGLNYGAAGNKTASFSAKQPPKKGTIGHFA